MAITKMAESDASDHTIIKISGHLSKEMVAHSSHIRDRAKRRAVEAMVTYHPEDTQVKPLPATTRVQ